MPELEWHKPAASGTLGAARLPAGPCGEMAAILKVQSRLRTIESVNRFVAGSLRPRKATRIRPTR
jgi:hypothetical protein